MKNIPKSTAKLQEVIDFYLVSQDFARLAASTQGDYERRLAHVSSTVVEGKRLGDYRCRNMRVRYLTQAYQVWLDAGVREANYRKACLSVAWQHGMRYDVMENDPVRLVRTLATTPRKVYWKRDQIRTFLDTAYSDFRWRSIGLIVHMAYDWAQRVGDMRLLTWDTLNLDQCTMDLTQSKRNAEIHLPISDGLCNMLRQQKEQFGFQDYVAPKPEPRAGAYTPYTKDEIGIIMNTILDEAGLPRELNAMDLRRTAVVEMMEAGVTEGNIIQVTGHKSFSSMLPYRVNTLSGASKALAARGNNEDE